MKNYRMNAVLAGLLYFLGTVFGVAGGIVGGEVLTSVISGSPLVGVDMLGLVGENAGRLNAAAFLTFMMGISLVGMTVFLYPLFRKDSEELAAGMLLFRGALEGTWYFLVTVNLLALVALGGEYLVAGSEAVALQPIGNVLYTMQDALGPVGTIAFLIGATCLYVSFYRTRLIPRWLTIWGFVGVVPYLAYAILHFFHLDSGYGFYLQMVLAPQEIVMGFWLIIKGFDREALDRLVSRA
jgi:hypothetical protein